MGINGLGFAGGAGGIYNPNTSNYAVRNGGDCTSIGAVNGKGGITSTAADGAGGGGGSYGPGAVGTINSSAAANTGGGGAGSGSGGSGICIIYWFE